MVSGILHFTIYSFLTQYFDKLNPVFLLRKGSDLIRRLEEFQFSTISNI
jgi:hypothetical protein